MVPHGKSNRRRPRLGLALALGLLGGVGAASAPARAEVVSFIDDVTPVIQLRCIECHAPGGAGFEKSGLDMSSYESLMKGTKYGPVIIPNSAFTSSLIAVIDRRTDREIWMPHKRKRLSKCERLIFRFWINQGAKDN